MMMPYRSTTRPNSILCPKPRWGTSRRLGWHGDNDSTPDYSDCRDRPLPSKKYNMQTSVRYRRKKILAAALSSITSGTSLKLQLIASWWKLENISTYYITLEIYIYPPPPFQKLVLQSDVPVVPCTTTPSATRQRLPLEDTQLGQCHNPNQVHDDSKCIHKPACLPGRAVGCKRCCHRRRRVHVLAAARSSVGHSCSAVKHTRRAGAPRSRRT